MVYATMYHNGIEASVKAKTIYWYLPREVGELLFYYLFVVGAVLEEVGGRGGREKERLE